MEEDVDWRAADPRGGSTTTSIARYHHLPPTTVTTYGHIHRITKQIQIRKSTWPWSLIWPGSYTIWQVLCNAVTLGSISYSWEILKICIRQWDLQIYAKMNDIPSPGRKSRCIYRQAIEETFYELFNPSPTMCSQCSPDKENTSGGCWWHLRGAQYLLRSHDRVQLWLNICAFSAFSNSMSLSAWSFIYYKS